MADLSVFLRDLHSAATIAMDLGVIDFLAAVMDAVGVQSASILSAYRSPETNAILARTTFGVADNSQHLYGRALDVHLGIRLADAVLAARAVGRGGHARSIGAVHRCGRIIWENLAADLGEFGIGGKVREVDLDAHDLVHVSVELAEGLADAVEGDAHLLLKANGLVVRRDRHAHLTCDEDPAADFGIDTQRLAEALRNRAGEMSHC